MFLNAGDSALIRCSFWRIRVRQMVCSAEQNVPTPNGMSKPHTLTKVTLWNFRPVENPVPGRFTQRQGRSLRSRVSHTSKHGRYLQQHKHSHWW